MCVCTPADEEDKRSPKASSTPRSVYQQEAEVRGKVDVRKGGFGEKVATLEDKAATVSIHGRESTPCACSSGSSAPTAIPALLLSSSPAGGHPITECKSTVPYRSMSS